MREPASGKAQLPLRWVHGFACSQAAAIVVGSRMRLDEKVHRRCSIRSMRTASARRFHGAHPHSLPAMLHWAWVLAARGARFAVGIKMQLDRQCCSAGAVWCALSVVAEHSPWAMAPFMHQRQQAPTTGSLAWRGSNCWIMLRTSASIDSITYQWLPHRPTSCFLPFKTQRPALDVYCRDGLPHSTIHLWLRMASAAWCYNSNHLTSSVMQIAGATIARCFKLPAS